ncbi:hypothetical protein M2422_004568 [Enterobacter sp. SLBN-59]|nr:hypothetical protein [Enterobacter sp. SLBN-59]
MNEKVTSFLSAELPVSLEHTLYVAPVSSATLPFRRKMASNTPGITTSQRSCSLDLIAVTRGESLQHPGSLDALFKVLTLHTDPVTCLVSGSVSELAAEYDFALAAMHGALSATDATDAGPAGNLTEMQNNDGYRTVARTQTRSRHWSELPAEEQERFWQDVDAGLQNDFLVAPAKKVTRRRRGDHSTKPKCEFPSWFRPERYKKLSGQLGYAYNRLVKINKTTGEVTLRAHVSRHPLFVAGRRKAGRKYAFRPERQRLMDAFWPLAISFCDAGKHSVVLCVSRLARELSPKDADGNVIPETEVTVSRLSRLIDEQVRFGVLGLSEERKWDRESRTWLPTHVYITPLGFQMLGVDMDKLRREQEKKLRLSAEREQLIREGVMREDEDISPETARKRWAFQKQRDALKYRRKKGAERKRANNLIKLPADERLHQMEKWVYKTLPPDEAYWCTPERLTQLAIQHLCQLDLALAPPD